MTTEDRPVDMTLSSGPAGARRTVCVAGALDVQAGNALSQVILALHDIIGSDVIDDLSRIRMDGDAARSTRSMLAHKFHEFGHPVQLPESLDRYASVN